MADHYGYGTWSNAVELSRISIQSEDSRAWHVGCYPKSVTSHVAEHSSLKSGSTVRILYVNGSGQTSERTISIKNGFTSRDGVAYVRAYCHLRMIIRTNHKDPEMIIAYTPIDYGHVGELSNAVGPTFTLDFTYSAPEMFGRPF